MSRLIATSFKHERRTFCLFWIILLQFDNDSIVQMFRDADNWMIWFSFSWEPIMAMLQFLYVHKCTLSWKFSFYLSTTGWNILRTTFVSIFVTLFKICKIGVLLNLIKCDFWPSTFVCFCGKFCLKLNFCYGFVLFVCLFVCFKKIGVFLLIQEEMSLISCLKGSNHLWKNCIDFRLLS